MATKLRRWLACSIGLVLLVQWGCILWLRQNPHEDDGRNIVVHDVSSPTRSGKRPIATTRMIHKDDHPWWNEYLKDLKYEYHTWRPIHSESYLVDDANKVLVDRNITAQTFGWCVQLTQSAAALIPNSTKAASFLPHCQSYNASKYIGGLLQTGPQMGLVFVKNPKAASSTGAGITLRIARRVAARLLYHHNASNSACPHVHACEHAWGHGMRRHRLLANGTTFLWTLVRHPLQKAQSKYWHFRISRGRSSRRDERHNISISQEEWQAFWENEQNAQIEYLVRKEYSNASVTPRLEQIQSIMQDYHFIGIVERMSESLIVLKLLLGLEYSDLLVLNAKQANSYDDGRAFGVCRYILPRPAFPQTIHNNNTKNWDDLLYASAHQALDATIARLGHTVVAHQVHQLEMMRKQVHAACHATTIFPCSSNGTWQPRWAATNCYWSDAGCGYPCIDAWVQTQHEQPYVDGGV